LLRILFSSHLKPSEESTDTQKVS